MKTFVVLVAIALMAHQTKQDCCPEVDGVKSAINYLHLFKSQADSDYNFYDISTKVELIYENETQNVVVDGVSYNQMQTILKVTVDGNPVRVFYYMQEALFNTNGSLASVVKFTRVRLKEGMTQDTDVVNYANSFFNTGTAITSTILNTVTACCLMKMEYINFYYLYSNYYADGRGNSLTC